jgi:hypothetical protein
MLISIVLLAVAVAGWGLGRVRKDVDLAMSVFAVFGAVTAHSTMQWAFLLEGRLDQVVGDPRGGAPAAAAVLVAAGEAVGLWLPVLLIPWARGAARFWGAAYMLSAAAAAAAYHYFPFDLPVMNDALVPGDGPPYLLAAFACLPIAAAGSLLGRMKSVDDDDAEAHERMEL